MAVRGARPKPTAMHELHGTLNVTRHRNRAAEPRPEGDLSDSDAPEWLTPSQQADWLHALAHAPAHLLKRIDRAVLTVWVLASDRLRTASKRQAELDEQTALPLLVKGKDGVIVESPYMRIIARQSEILLRAGAELGFTPSSRPRLAPPALPEEPSESPWARIAALKADSAAH